MCDETGWITERTTKDWIFTQVTSENNSTQEKNGVTLNSGLVISSNQGTLSAEARLPLNAENLMYITSDVSIAEGLPLLNPGDEIIKTIVVGHNDTSVDDVSQEKARQFVEVIDENTYRCKICGFLSDKMENVSNHLTPAHGDEWKKSNYGEVNSERQVLVESSLRGNIHLDPDWKKNLKRSFLEEVVPQWSKVTLNAWTFDEEITDPKKFKKVRAEIKDDLVDHILKFFGTSKTPSLSILEDIVADVLSVNYSFMFSQREGSASTIPSLNFGRGFGGIKGVKNLPSQLWNDIYLKQIKMRQEEEGRKRPIDNDLNGDENGCPKKGKKPHKHGNNLFYFKILGEVLNFYLKLGVDNHKYYAASTLDQDTELRSTVGMTDEDERERIYSSNRAAIMKNIRESEKVMDKVIRGFFKSPLHLHKMFEHLTGVSNLRENIQSNLLLEIEKMEKVLISKDIKYKDKLKSIQNMVETDYHGNDHFRFVSVLRLIVKTIDKDEKSFLLFEHEDIATTGPFLRVIEGQDSRFVTTLLKN